MILGIVAGSVSQSSYLDQLGTQPIQCCSLSKRISTATAAIRVRRSSDNAEQDIGFAGNNLDSADLVSFASGGSAYVVTYYDQTGNGHDFNQANASQQARIVNAGVYDDGTVFDGVDDGYSSDSVPFGGQFAWAFVTFQQSSNTNVKVLMELSADYGAGSDRFIVYDYSTQGGIVASMGAVGATRANSFVNAGSMAMWSFKFDRQTTGSSQIMAWEDGSLMTATPVGGSTTDQSGTFGNYAMNLGARNGGASLPSSAKIREAIVYADDVSSIRTSIETILAS